MSRKERDWLKVLTRVVKRELRLKEAAFLMAVSCRQCLRRLSRSDADRAPQLKAVARPPKGVRMHTDDSLRKHVAALLGWRDAHVDFDTAVKGIPPRLRGVTPTGLPYSPWQLLEHLRLAQFDILDFCINPDYRAPNWPDDYWPHSPSPPHSKAWQQSIAAFRADLRALMALLGDPAIDLCSTIPHGQGQTYIREFFLVADHNAFHVGEIVVVRRLLGNWP